MPSMMPPHPPERSPILGLLGGYQPTWKVLRPAGLPCCPAGWDGFQGQCYRVFTASQNWSQARATCRDHDALLATVQGPAEQVRASAGSR